MAKQARCGRLILTLLAGGPSAEVSAAGAARQADIGPATPSHALTDRADLAGANLANADFRGAKLRFADFAAANLGAADLARADLRLARFDRANLDTADLSEAVLDHASFIDARLTGAKLIGASLRFANLEGAEFGNAHLANADLCHARLERANLEGANLRGTRLDYADFSGATLAGADLSGAQLRYAKHLAGAQLDSCRVSEATVLPLYLADGEDRPWAHRQGRGSGSRPRQIAAAAVVALASLGMGWQLLHPPGTLLREAPPVGLDEAASVTALRREASPPPRALIAAELPTVDTSTAVSARPSPARGAAELSGQGPAVARRLAMAAELASLSPMLRAPNIPAAPLGVLPVAVAARALGLAQADQVEAVASSILRRPMPLRGKVRTASVAPRRLHLSMVSPPLLSDVVPPLAEAIAALPAVTARDLAPEQQATFTGGPVNAPAAVFPAFEPLTLVVSLHEQKLDVYRGTGLVTSSKVSSGKRGYDTRAGVFSILEKRRYHHSNLYSGAPMPWMQRLTRTGTALHAGLVPGYPASHGCIRLPFSFAPKLFQMTSVGANVVVAGGRLEPRLIEHADLFVPDPPPAAVAQAVAELNPLALPSAAAEENPGPPASQAGDTAEPAPLRILVTRRTERDQIISTQYVLAALGYLTPQNFTGRVGKETIGAIKAFQKANGLVVTGAFSADLAKKVREAAGQAEPPAGHLFVRQDFLPVFDAPVAFRDPDRPLGTHLFTMGVAQNGAKAEWMAFSLEGADAADALDRIEIPDAARRRIAALLVPGSSLIVADTSVNSAILPDGDDFMVLAKVEPAAGALGPQQGSVKQEAARQAKAKRAKAAHGAAQTGPQRRQARRLFAPDPYGGFRLFGRW
jgi:uncharacterized protein YjbI with pentapeptide repeats/peptidoglycan hydrolase-like protein with peptidoglycan-binding domain